MSPKIFKDFLLFLWQKKKSSKYEKSNYVPLAMTIKRDSRCVLLGLGNYWFIALSCA